MPDRPASERPTSGVSPAARDALARRRRLADVFGEALPEQTGDDVDQDAAGGTSEDWLRREVPPHHGG